MAKGPLPEPRRPLKIEGRCAWCSCGREGALIELPAPDKSALNRVYMLRCPACVEIVAVTDPWKPPEKP